MAQPPSTRELYSINYQEKETMTRMQRHRETADYLRALMPEEEEDGDIPFAIIEADRARLAELAADEDREVAKLEQLKARRVFQCGSLGGSARKVLWARAPRQRQTSKAPR